MFRSLPFIFNKIVSKSTNLSTPLSTNRPGGYILPNQSTSGEEDKTKNDNQSTNSSNYINTIAMVGIAGLLSQKLDDITNFWWFNSSERNKIKSRISDIQYPANHPIEDRFSYNDFQNIEGFSAIVYDGHGGWQVAEWASRTLHHFLDQEFLSLKQQNQNLESEDNIKAAITKAFDKVENEFVEVARSGYDMGFSKMASMGACCLCAVVIDNKLYVANSGDCRGVMIQKNGKTDNGFDHQKLNSKQNANSKKVQKYLREKFPNDRDIVVCKNNNPDACYVKGR